MKAIKILFVLVAALALCASSKSQTAGEKYATGTITGEVKDTLTQKPLAYANVIVLGTSLGAMTGHDGKYNIKDVPAGEYSVKAMMMGYEAKEKQRVSVKKNQVTVLKFELTRTIVLKTQEIIVTGERPLVEVSESDMRVNSTSKDIMEMPVDDVSEALALRTGKVKTGNELYVRGSRGSGVSYCYAPPEIDWNTESYDRIYDNDFYDVIDEPFSTFSVDVDAASYSNIRRFLRRNQMPPVDAVRIEELINYFTYDYPEPSSEQPFSITTEVSPCPWNGDNRLVHIGLQGRHIDMKDAPPSNLVFLIDVSGSMTPANKLPLLRKAFVTFVENLRHEDRVAIVVYAGAAGMILRSTPGDEKKRIISAIENLEAGGSTAGGEGIVLAYKVAADNFIEGGNNRVILATDGDFNVGVSSDGAMVRLIEEKRKSGIFLTVLGFGEGNLKDAKMEKIADHGNGHYAYIDDIFEARKVLVNEMSATLFTIAKDVKIQVEFNPAKVKSYRLIGYENRILAKKDFEDDKKDAGEIGAGHSVTALYEIVPVTSETMTETEQKTSYMIVSIDSAAFDTAELLTVRFRYKEPDEDDSKLIVQTLDDGEGSFDNASVDFRFAAAVAEFGMLLRNSAYKGDANFEHVLHTAKKSIGKDKFGYRHEFVRLVEMCKEIAQDERE